MSFSILISTLAILGATPALLEEASTPSPDPVPVERIAEARQVLEDGLRDYSSAKFRNTFARKGAGNSIQFCGQMNAMNGFGAPTGWKDFILTVGERPDLISASCGDTTNERISPTDYAPALSPASPT